MTYKASLSKHTNESTHELVREEPSLLKEVSNHIGRHDDEAHDASESAQSEIRKIYCQGTWNIVCVLQ